MLMAQHFAPEAVSGAVLATELASDLAARGHEVMFVTSAPNYPQGVVFPGYRNRLFGATETLNGVRVERVWSYISPDRSFAARALNHATYSLTAFSGGARGGRAAGRPDVIFSFSPPLPLGLSAWALSRMWGAPWILRVEDLYPDAAVAAGALSNSQAIRFFAALERFLYARADHVSLISEGFRRNLLAKGEPSEKLSVTPVWADAEAVRPMPKENAFRQEHGLSDKFVLLYAGNLGHASAVEDILAAAERMKEDAEVRFLFVGEGVKKPVLQALAVERGLDNVAFLPYQPRERFSELMAAADVSFVTLNARSAAFSMPSKVYNVMASARPALVIAPEESDVAALAREGRFGLIAPPGEPEAVVAAIRTLRDAAPLRKEMGYNGRRLIELRYARPACVAAFERLMQDAVAEGARP